MTTCVTAAVANSITLGHYLEMFQIRRVIPELLLPLTFLSQNWPTGDEVLEDWTKRVAEEHKSHW